MIGKIPDKRRDGKSSFRDLVAYCTTREPAKVMHVGFQNLLSPDTAAIEMEALATDNRRCKDPAFHVILSWREFELPTNDQVDEAVGIVLGELGLHDCQALWALQNDTQNRHVHIVVNRIHPETGRAIQPANNWTYRAVERAARMIELRQGWEIEQSGRFFVTPEGEIVERRQGAKGCLSNRSRDAEAHTAIKSPERVCLEIVAPILREAKSWLELHERLVQEGIAFERKGSGALLHLLGVTIKPSSIGRDLSLSKLCERLGEFQPRREEFIVMERSPESVEKVAASGTNAEWKRYTKAREKYRTEKKEASETLRDRQREERGALRLRQKTERDISLSGSWKGRGALLNRRRSVLAARQLGERLDLRDRQKQEMERFRRVFPGRFPNFKSWLEVEGEQNALLRFRYSESDTMRTVNEPAEAVPAGGTLDLRDFTPRIGNRGGVAYARAVSQEAAFVDYGRRIVLGPKLDESAVLAALQLANQKWGGAVVEGSDEYKRTCVALAIRHNLRIANPDLAREVAEGRRRNMEWERRGSMAKTGQRSRQRAQQSQQAEQKHGERDFGR